VTMLTPPEPRDVLVSFYRKIRPSATGWKPVALLAPEVKPTGDLLANLVDWIAGLILIYGVLFGTGKLLLHEPGVGALLLACGLAGGAVIYFDLSRRGWSAVTE
jgi:SSS family solute:Na+ symporter